MGARRKVARHIFRTRDEWIKNCIIDKKTRCWIWQGALSNGYGYLQVDGAAYQAHRFGYELFYGKITRRYVVRHKCDNRPCVNPAHLIKGSYTDNINDAYARHPQRELRKKKLAEKFRKMWIEQPDRQARHQKQLGRRMKQLWRDPVWRRKSLNARKS